MYDENGSALSAFRTEKYSTEAANASNHLYTEQQMSNKVQWSERVEVQISNNKFSASCTQIFLKSSQVGIPLAYDGEQVNWNENHSNEPPVFTECDFLMQLQLGRLVLHTFSNQCGASVHRLSVLRNNSLKCEHQTVHINHHPHIPLLFPETSIF